MGVPQPASRDWPSPRRAKPRRLEDAQQIALMNWAHFVTVGQHRLFDLLIHIPNGGWRRPGEAGRFKAMGVKPGIPDLHLPVPVGRYHGAYWELKVGDNDATDHQVSWQKFLSDQGYYVAMFWDWQETAKDILRYLRMSPEFDVVARVPLA